MRAAIVAVSLGRYREKAIHQPAAQLADIGCHDPQPRSLGAINSDRDIVRPFGLVNRLKFCHALYPTPMI